jgi:DMSO/TMAO reductase YedYZ molybdopterin-dependent catalytic subunit
VTQWLDDRVQHIDPDDWALDIDGAVHDLAGLREMVTDELTAILYCTSGWYSVQFHRGVRLDRLVDPTGWRSIEVRSVTGYARRFPVRDLDRLWLCLDMGGEPISAGHGFPARLVAPDRRGFWWVKWVVSITPSDRPWWVQSPFPVT